MVVESQMNAQPDQFSEYDAEYIDGSYDCVDRIVLNAYWSLGQSGGGFRTWWRRLHGTDENLDTTHLMRYARNYARRVRAYASTHEIPVVDCEQGVRKHELAEQYLPSDPDFVGVFLILASRFSAPVWEVNESPNRQSIHLVKKYPFVKQYWFHILDPDWGHLTIRISPHPPFGAQIFLNGHEYVAREARRQGITFDKVGNSFSNLSDAAGLARIADTLYSQSAIGQLRQACERWISSTCLCFALSLAEQEQTGFSYQYSVYQTELSRNLLFARGSQMDQIVNSVIDHIRSRLDLKKVKTIFGTKHRPHRRQGKKAPRMECVVERPTYDMTAFNLHFGCLTLRLYTKGANTLRIEVIAHHIKRLYLRRSLPYLEEILAHLRPILLRFLNTIQGVSAAFVADDFLDRLPQPAYLGATRLAGIQLDQARIRAVLQAVLALAPTPNGFTASQLAAQVCHIQGLPHDAYSARQAAYDLKKLRAKELVVKRGQSRKYLPSPEGLSTISALLTLREHVIKPVLAGAGKPKPGRPPKNLSRLNELYISLQSLMRTLFLELGFAL